MAKNLLCLLMYESICKSEGDNSRRKLCTKYFYYGKDLTLGNKIILIVSYKLILHDSLNIRVYFIEQKINNLCF